jgi:signal transduction histidine kinase
MIMAEEQTSFIGRKRATSGRPPASPSPAPQAEEAAVQNGTHTANLRLQDVLRQVEQKHRALLSIVPDLLFHVRKDGVVLGFQAPKDSEWALAADDVVGKRVVEMLPTQIGLQATYHVEKALRTGAVEVFSCQFQMPGRTRDFEARIAACAPGEVLAVVRDATQRRQMEKEIVEISNRTQARIGQDLHDGLGQHLTGITFLCKALERKLADKALPEAAEAGEIGQMVLQALTQTRNLARGLFPVELESGGLVAALHELAETVQEMFNIACELECDEAVAIENASLATNLFRIAQEAINNAVKHGKAKRVVISLRAEGDLTLFSIADDGVGFPVAASQSKGLGLRIMTYRAQRIGGTLEVRPHEHGGTVVSCSFRASAAPA